MSTTLRVPDNEETWPEWARPRNQRHMHNYDHIEPQRLLQWALALERRVQQLEENQNVWIFELAGRVERKELIPQLIHELQRLTEEEEQ